MVLYWYIQLKRVSTGHERPREARGQPYKPLSFCSLDLHLTFFFSAVVLDDQPKMSSAMMIDEDEANKTMETLNALGEAQEEFEAMFETFCEIAVERCVFFRGIFSSRPRSSGMLSIIMSYLGITVSVTK